MSKLIKLTAVVSALAMLFVCLAVPAMAAETVVFSDNFEWGTDYTTTSNLVHKSGTSIGGAGSTQKSDANTYGYFVKGLTSPTTAIITDSDSAHGQVLKYNAGTGTTRVNRGVFLDIPTAKHVDGYTSIEYDYKPETGGDLSTIIATMPKGGANDTIIWSTFNNFLFEQGPYLYGTYNYNNNGTIKTIELTKQLTWSNYLPANLLADDGTLSKAWHNIKYVYDPNTVTYDLYVDGYLIAAGCGRYGSDLSTDNTANSMKGHVVARILLGGRKDNGNSSFEAYYDNFKVKKLEAEDVYAARKAAFEKAIGCAEGSKEGIINKDERIEVASGHEGIFLPYQGAFGINTIEHGAYRLVATDAEVVNEAANAPISYSDVSFDAVTAAGTRTSEWSGVNLAYRTLSVTKEEALANADLLSGLNTYTSTASCGAESYIGFSHFDGNAAEPKLTLTVDFSNGKGILEKTYTIAFRRDDLQNDLQDTIELRDAGWRGLASGKITETGALNHYTYIGNNTGKDVTVFGAMIFYDANGNVLATAAGEHTAKANTDVSTFTTQTQGFRLRFGNGNSYYLDEATGEWKRATTSSPAPAGVETVGALESIYANVKYDTKKIRIFLWDKATLQPLMTDMEVSVDTPRP